jgi:hypothetical protein
LLTCKLKKVTNPTNSKDKPSPADTPTQRPNDKGGKSIVGSDGNYTDRKLRRLSIAEQRERDEQPVESIKSPPAEKGMEKGKVQP